MRLLRSISICSIWLALALSSRAQTSTAASYDFNGDGFSDIVWRNYRTGTNWVWYMRGTQYVSLAQLPSMPVLGWRLVAICDYNNDGSPDIVWRDYKTGKNLVWLMKKTKLLETLDLPTVSGANWGLSGVGDFNGDGQVDLVWSDSSTGRRVIWLMHGAQIASKVELNLVNTEWQIAVVQDLNGDGKADLLWVDIWRGQVAAWIMNGTTVTSKLTVGTISDPNFRMQSAVVDLGGPPLILWRNYYNGSDWIQPLRNLQFGNPIKLPAEPDTNWQMVGPSGIDPASLLSDREKNMLQQEAMTLAAGGYDDIGGLPAVSSLYEMHGNLVFTFPHPAKTSKMYQAKKQILDSDCNNNRLNQEAVEQAMGGYNGSDPVTGLQAWFGPSGEEWVWGDFTWK